MKIKNTWEEVIADGSFTTSRLKTSGGWVVRVENTDDVLFGVCFVPDPEWSWEPSTTDDD